MTMLKEYYDSKIEGLRFTQFLAEINLNYETLSKEEKIKIYKLWIMGYSRKEIKASI